MNTRDRERAAAENRRWLQNEMERRRLAKRAAALHTRPIDGLSPIRIPSLAEGLDEIQPTATRAAGGGA